MKAFVLTFALLAASSAPAFAQTTLASWSFENSPLTNVAPAVTSTGNQYSIAASSGVGTATGSHASAATIWSSPVGNGSAKSLSSDHWGLGDYYQFQTSTMGFSGVSLSWDQTGSSTGPKFFTLQYSTNGTNFTDFSNYILQVNASPNTPWLGSGSPNPMYSYNYDLSSISVLNNTANVYFRLTDGFTTSFTGGTVATSGSDRVDNFTITAIPEPSTYAFLMGAATTASVFFLRRRPIHPSGNSIA